MPASTKGIEWIVISVTQSLAFLDSTFGIVAGLRELSVAIKKTITVTHGTITKYSPWGGRLLSTYGGQIWRAILAPAVRCPFLRGSLNDSNFEFLALLR